MKQGDQSELHREVQRIFLDSVEALAQSPEQMVAAVGYGLERVFDQLIRQACEELGADADAFAAELDSDDALRATIQQRLAELFNPDAVERARAEAVRKEAERHLYVLRFVLSGTDAPQWVWASMDPNEAQRLRAFRDAGGDEDPELLARVQNAVGKLGGDAARFGRCESCGKAISTERLQLVPYAERCVKCQRAADSAPSETVEITRVPVWMFFEGGKPVPPDKRLAYGAGERVVDDAS